MTSCSHSTSVPHNWPVKFFSAIGRGLHLNSMVRICTVPALDLRVEHTEDITEITEDRLSFFEAPNP